MALSELTIYRDHPSWLYFSGLLSLAGISFLISASADNLEGGLLLASLFLVLVTFARYRRLYTVTDHRIIMKIGIIANNTNEMEINHIRGINVRQNPLERVLGIGTLEFVSAADGSVEVIFSGIRNPVNVKEKIRKLKRLPYFSSATS